MDNSFIIEAPQLQQLIEVLQSQGYGVLGPTLRQDDLVYDEVRATADLPVGWLDEHEAGSFRLIRGEAQTFFGCLVGQHSWKQFLFPSNLRLWQAQQQEKQRGPAQQVGGAGNASHESLQCQSCSTASMRTPMKGGTSRQKPSMQRMPPRVVPAKMRA